MLLNICGKTLALSKEPTKERRPSPSSNKILSSRSSPFKDKLATDSWLNDLNNATPLHKKLVFSSELFLLAAHSAIMSAGPLGASVKATRPLNTSNMFALTLTLAKICSNAIV